MVLDTSILHNPLRLDTLHRLALLDSPPEASFDRLTRLTSRFLNTPIAYFAVFDSSRFFFKSEVGLPPPLSLTRELAISYSLCQYVVASGKPLVIEDTRLHPLSAGSYLVQEYQVISYIGIPLTANGQVLGTFTVMDGQPRAWTTVELDTLSDIVSMVTTEIELRGELYERSRTELALRESEDYLNSVLELSLDAFVTMDAEGMVTRWNGQAEAMFGWTAAEAIGQSLGSMIVPPRYRAAHGAGVNRFLATAESKILNRRIQISGVDRTGREFPIELEVTAIHGKDRPTFSAFLRDITERQRAEDELRQALAREREVNDLKTRFSSMVSHEFRTPLAVIQSSSDLLRRYIERMSVERRDEHLSQIQEQVKHLVSLLDDILTLGKAESVGIELRPEPLDLVQFCHDLVAEMQLAAGATRIVLTVGGSASIMIADAKLLRQTLNNLLSNAVKYSPTGSRVEFTLHFEATEVVMQITDQGIGIPEADQAHLFDMFHRANNVGSIAGTGLGLPIVKHAVEAHGGTVRCESVEGVGTTFTVRLPRLTGMIVAASEASVNGAVKQIAGHS